MFFRKKRKKEIRTIDKGSTREIPGITVINGNKRNSSGILSYQVANLQMVGTRERQEDSFALINSADVTKILEQGLFAVVCDGMGGLEDGKLISEAAVQGFVSHFYNLDLESKEFIPVQLADACHSVNSQVTELYGTAGGTTVVMGLVFDAEFYWAAVGDSLIFLKRGNSLIRLNKEHIYLNDLYLKELSRETIDKSTAESDGQKESLTEYIGKKAIKEIDFNKKPFPLAMGDVIFLCSDGVSSYISEPEISAALDLPPKEACSYIDSAIKSINHPAQDNYTCVIITCV